jgi:hypothetical protein
MLLAAGEKYILIITTSGGQENHLHDYTKSRSNF